MPAPRSTVVGGTIIGWGAALPDTVVTNHDLAASLDTDADWIVARTGIHSRCGGGTTSSLAIEAGAAALANAQIDPATIDTLILATTTPDRQMPATASAVQHGLGLRCGAMDVNAVCAGFVYALTVAYALVGLGSQRVLLIGADVMSRITDWDDRNTAILFDDGAGAVVIEASAGPQQLLGWDLDSDGSALDALYADIGDFIQMNGREVFRRAVRIMADSARRAMAAAGITIDDVALMVPHQGNQRIIEATCERLGLPAERSAMVLQRTGNTSSASIPIALTDALDTGRVGPDDLLLLVGFGAGMTAASAVLRWGHPTAPSVQIGALQRTQDGEGKNELRSLAPGSFPLPWEW